MWETEKLRWKRKLTISKKKNKKSEKKKYDREIIDEHANKCRMASGGRHLIACTSIAFKFSVDVSKFIFNFYSWGLSEFPP